ncbi:hypothetical protein BV898_17423 [Hypsibius exemplaris]|uniref:Uncharacterized protein n=1 Tax=Hypsibius exemplaris TaxID=2072580 RepID=A0A9X6RMF9_HYPEX|nr:hypothetical protein BV898_17423 [Hypsibius exemplaris]
MEALATVAELAKVATWVTVKTAPDSEGQHCEEHSLSLMCNKNKGEGEQGYAYSREYFFIVRESGIIDIFALFRKA